MRGRRPLLGFLYENGFGVPQALWTGRRRPSIKAAAVRGDCLCTRPDSALIYDKGPRRAAGKTRFFPTNGSILAAAHASKRERDYYLRLRNAVASKMSSEQIP